MRALEPVIYLGDYDDLIPMDDYLPKQFFG